MAQEQRSGTTFTAEDFAWLADLLARNAVNIEHPTPTIVRPPAEQLVLAALREAERIRRPGLIEDIIQEWNSETPGKRDGQLWDRIRAALTSDEQT